MVVCRDPLRCGTPEGHSLSPNVRINSQPTPRLVESALRRRGLAAQLRLGTRTSEQRGLNAHAWVELEGVALAQSNLVHTPFPPLDATPR